MGTMFGEVSHVKVPKKVEGNRGLVLNIVPFSDVGRLGSVRNLKDPGLYIVGSCIESSRLVPGLLRA